MKRLLVWLVVLGALAAPPAADAAVKACSPADLEGRIMCPTCEGQTVDQSPAPAAARIRAFIRKWSAAGATCSQVEDRLVAEFGESVRAAPPASGFGLLAWLLPLVGLGVGAVVVGLLAWRWSRRREGASVPGVPEHNGRARLDPELERKLDEELARFD
jgi:cytochrome c-type biogenesis protein CcmH